MSRPRAYQGKALDHERPEPQGEHPLLGLLLILAIAALAWFALVMAAEPARVVTQALGAGAGR